MRGWGCRGRVPFGLHPNNPGWTLLVSPEKQSPVQGLGDGAVIRAMCRRKVRTHSRLSGPPDCKISPYSASSAGPCRLPMHSRHESVNFQALGAANLSAIKATKTIRIDFDTRVDFAPIGWANKTQPTHDGLPEPVELQSKSPGGKKLERVSILLKRA